MLKSVAVALLALGMSCAVVISCDARDTASPDARASAGRKELTLDLGHKATLRLVQIPAGKFVMDVHNPARSYSGYPIHGTVTFERPFYMGITHVTVDQFAAFVKDTGYKTDGEKLGFCRGYEMRDGKLNGIHAIGASWRKPTIDQRGDHPVLQVSWNDAKAFCGWLSKKSGRTVALPTGAQWEYACRAGTTTMYLWGDNFSEGKGWGNFSDQSLVRMLPSIYRLTFCNWDDGFVFTSPVGSFKPNGFGLYDMIGNVWHWCEDHTGTNGDYRVLRGGSWDCSQENAYRSSHSIGGKPDHCQADYGFRVLAPASEGDPVEAPAQSGSTPAQQTPLAPLGPEPR